MNDKPVESFSLANDKIYATIEEYHGDELSKEAKPAPYFRKTFHPHKAIKSARAYIAVGGLYDLYINGKRIGDHVLDPILDPANRLTCHCFFPFGPCVSNRRPGDGIGVRE